MACTVILLSFLVGAAIAVAVLINRYKEKERAKMRMIIESMLQQSAPTWSVSKYLARIETASVEIMSQAETVDKTIILWCGLDGLRMNEDGSLEWISLKETEEKEESQPVNQNVSYQPAQSISMDMAQTSNSLDMLTCVMRNMCQSTLGHIEAVRNAERICATAQTIPMQLPPLPMMYPSGYCDPYKPHFQGNLNGFCCNQTMF